MQCPRCHNNNPQRMYKVKGIVYCRQCISFRRVNIDCSRQTQRQDYRRSFQDYHLDFQLSLQQKQLSFQLLDHYQKGHNTCVLAVCGSGKTEIVFETIAYALSQGQRVCFCMPRKALVKELATRMQSAFPKADIGILYGGYHYHVDAQLIVCTMHQLYQFENQVGFDLMIADEVDAFPFYQNQVLHEIFQRCCLGHTIQLSATFVKEDIRDDVLLVMNRRYHGCDLPVPQMILCPQWVQQWLVCLLIYRLQKKVIVFVPTIACVKRLTGYLQRFFLVKGVSSQQKYPETILEELKSEKIQVIVATTILERGITVADVQVIICYSEHPLFDERTLIQMAGRVGRKPEYPMGKVYILTSERTREIRRCIKTIKRLNQKSV